jgi:hypothetical protein
LSKANRRLTHPEQRNHVQSILRNVARAPSHASAAIDQLDKFLLKLIEKSEVKENGTLEEEFVGELRIFLEAREFKQTMTGGRRGC